jgi:hypothetical protein
MDQYASPITIRHKKMRCVELDHSGIHRRKMCIMVGAIVYRSSNSGAYRGPSCGARIESQDDVKSRKRQIQARVPVGSGTTHESGQLLSYP